MQDVSFQKEIEKVINNAIQNKMKELDQREKTIQEREKTVNKILENEKSEKIVLRVGQKVFHTRSSVILKIQDSFFHGLLNPKFHKEGEEYFISRDGSVFKYVLEYLTYGEIYRTFKKKDLGKLQLLLLDADYYSLPILKEQVLLIQKNLENSIEPIIPESSNQKYITIENGISELGMLKKKKSGLIAKWQSTSGAGNGGYWNWNNPIIKPDTEFFQATNNQTIQVKKKGTYLILIRVSGTFSSNGYYIELYVNGGSGYSRSMEGANDGYYHSFQINEIFEFNENTTLQVYQTTNGSPNNTQICNQFSIMKIK